MFDWNAPAMEFYESLGAETLCAWLTMRVEGEALSKLAVEEDCGRFEWQVLDWNTPAIKFYELLGAKTLREWLTMRVSGEALTKLAAHAQT